MNEEFYCILKLVSGEQLLSLIYVDDSNEEDPIIVLQNPVVIESVHAQNTSYLKIKPWMELSEDDIFMIRLDKVITMTETNDKKLINVYKSYHDNSINNIIDSTGKVTLSNDMGYITSVNQARESLENLYKGIKE
jgi:uncharacterized protein (UPF0297 family)